MKLMDFNKVRLFQPKFKLLLNGVKEKEVSAVVLRVEELLKKFADKPFKIGKTDNPSRREKEHRNDGFQTFRIVFEHSSLDVIDYMEQYLIRYFKMKETAEDDIVNKKFGGEGRRTERNKYYIYVIIKTNSNETI